jgi:hypothetical protein
MHAHCDVLVVGAGRSGRAAAASAGGRVLLAHGLLEADEIALGLTWVVGFYPGNYALGVERGRRLWRIRARQVVLATGALERPPVFPNNDRPGIMLASAAARYGNPEGVTPVSAGWSPRVHLWSQAGGALRWDDRIGAPVPAGQLPGVDCVGRLTVTGCRTRRRSSFTGATRT